MDVQPDARPPAFQSDPVEDAMACYLTHPDVQAAIESFDLQRYGAALANLATAAPDDHARQALERLSHTRRPFARPLANRLPLFLTTWGGCGFRLIGEEDRVAGTHATTRWLTIFFLPLWPLRGYLVREVRGYEYQFLAEIPFDKRHRWAVVAIPVALALFAALVHFGGLGRP